MSDISSYPPSEPGFGMVDVQFVWMDTDETRKGQRSAKLKSSKTFLYTFNDGRNTWHWLSFWNVLEAFTLKACEFVVTLICLSQIEYEMKIPGL